MQRRHHHARQGIALLAVGIIALTACGSDDNSTVSEPTSETTATDEGANRVSTVPPQSSTTVIDEPTTTSEPSTTVPIETTTTSTEPAATTTVPATGNGTLRGLRYCEVLLVQPGDGGPTAEVWGTQGVNLCPAESWDALDPTAIQAEYEALGVKMNGPRHFVIDGVFGMQLPESETRFYGDLEMQLLATVDIEATTAAPYTEVAVARSNTWVFNAGSEIYVLTDPDGIEYVMQAYSQIVDPELTEVDLPGLGERLALPDGWAFSTRALEQDLEVSATNGVAVVVQDELENTYQRR